MATAVVMVVADIVVAAVVSKVVATVVTEVAIGLGMSESAAGILGGIAGIVGGSYAYGAGSSALGGASRAGQAGSAAAGASETAAATAEVGGSTAAMTSDIGAGASLSATDPSAINLTGDIGQGLGYAESAAPVSLAADTGSATGALAGSTAAPAEGTTSAPSAAQGAAAQAPTAVAAPAAAPPSAGTAWYEKMWDKEGGELVGGMIKGSSTEMLKANAAAKQGKRSSALSQEEYERTRRDELADRSHMEWGGKEKFRGLTPGDFGSSYDPTYVSREEQGLLTAGV